MPQALRQTEYATEIARGSFGDYRIELLHIKNKDRKEVRFSWWPNGQMQPRPLDVTEDELLPLMQDALRESVFTRSFLQQLSATIDDHLKQTA